MKLRSLILASTMVLGALGCSGNDDKPNDQGMGGEGPGPSGQGGEGGEAEPGEQILQLFSWWKAPGEAEALRALKDTYTAKFEGARIAEYANPTAGTWQEELAAKIEDSPWDVCQMSASDLTKFREDHPGSVAELDDIYADAKLDEVMIPAIREIVTRESHPYGVVTGIHRNNAFLYNKQIFDEQGLEPPTTVAEFIAVSDQLVEAGITPVASDMDTWVLRILFDEILAGTLGAEDFTRLLSGDLAPADAEAQITSAIGTFDKILTEYVDVERSSEADYDWTSAAQDLHDGNAAMLFHGDWAKGYLVYLDWEPGIDFGVLGPPGASELFVYGADMFFLPSTAPHPKLAHDFMSVVASPEGQVAFNSYKGATPMRIDVRDDLDEPGKLSLDGLIAADEAGLLIPGHANAAWDAGIEAFALDHDKDALLNVYLTAEP
jgi:glucose/mannose transport system substrate-binding protein